MPAGKGRRPRRDDRMNRRVREYRRGHDDYARFMIDEMLACEREDERPDAVGRSKIFARLPGKSSGAIAGSRSPGSGRDAFRRVFSGYRHVRRPPCGKGAVLVRKTRPKPISAYS